MTMLLRKAFLILTLRKTGTAINRTFFDNSMFEKVKNKSINYTPISLLPLLSKVFRIVVLDQTEEFLSLNKILYHYQSGFRKNHSTDT